MKIVCFGDSNTYGYDPRSYFGERLPREERWVDIMAEKLGYIVVNAGENGREIPVKEWELDEINRLLIQEHPVDLVVIMLGTNDILQGKSASAIANAMERFLRQVPIDPCNIVLIAPPFLQWGDWVTSLNLINISHQVTEAYRALSKTLGVQFVDAQEWKPQLAFDGVHLSQKGHAAFADGLANYLKKENEKCYRQE